MKKLMLIRHGSTQNNSKVKDIERQLTQQGIEDSLSLGKFIRESNSVPDLIISSSAQRAKTTANNLIAGGTLKSIFLVEEAIYGGNSNFLLYLLSEQDNSYNNICLVGHEPHFSTFIYNMTNCNNFILNTANLAIIDVEIEKWEHIEYKKGILSLHITPNELKL